MRRTLGFWLDSAVPLTSRVFLVQRYRAFAAGPLVDFPALAITVCAASGGPLVQQSNGGALSAVVLRTEGCLQDWVQAQPRLHPVAAQEK